MSNIKLNISDVTNKAWELAKKHATTVEAIMRANDLKDEPGPEKILLIPVP